MIRKNIESKNFKADAESALTAVRSLNRIFKKVNSDGLNDETETELADDIKLVSERFGVCPRAAILLSAVMEKNNSSCSCDEEDLANFVGCTNLEFFEFHDALRELEDKWIVGKCGGRRSSYKATLEAVKAVEKDTEFAPIKTTGLNADEYFSRLRRLMQDFRNDIIDGDRLDEGITNLTQNNEQLLFCRKVLGSCLWKFNCSQTEREQFFYLCHRYVTHNNQSVPIDILMNFTNFLDDDQRIRRNFANEKSSLQTSGLVCFGIEDGFVNKDFLSLSDEVKATFFDEVELAPAQIVADKNIISWETLPEIELFYNEEEGKTVERLAEILEEDNFKAVQQRLKEQNMPTGMSVVMFGGPGSGKTATLKSLARRTQRDLFWVDISALKSKYVGESEKLIKELFTKYRKLARASKRAPILAVNECDAIFNKRLTNVDDSVDQMNNAITDIILNELETLEGICICTTNLMGNMMDETDSAMERRFLFKIEFNAPGEEVREKIWKSKLPDIADEDAKSIASEFALSGGNIDNVARKSTVDYVLTGRHADVATLRKYCRDESVARKNGTNRIGF